MDDAKPELTEQDAPTNVNKLDASVGPSLADQLSSIKAQLGPSTPGRSAPPDDAVHATPSPQLRLPYATPSGGNVVAENAGDIIRQCAPPHSGGSDRRNADPYAYRANVNRLSPYVSEGSTPLLKTMSETAAEDPLQHIDTVVETAMIARASVEILRRHNLQYQRQAAELQEQLREQSRAHEDALQRQRARFSQDLNEVRWEQKQHNRQEQTLRAKLSESETENQRLRDELARIQSAVQRFEEKLAEQGIGPVFQ
jgi:hypothetical protein